MEFLGRLQAMFNGLIADPALAQLSFVALLGFAVFALLVAAVLLVAGLADPLRRRLQQIEAQSADGTLAAGPGMSIAGSIDRKSVV